MNKTAIRKFAEWAREKLIEDIKYKAGLVGITENGIAERLSQSTSDLHFYDVGTKDYTKISGIEIKQRDALVKAIQTKERSYKSYQETFENVIEEVAYTWFNRLIAIRFMEVNDYLPSSVRVLSSDNKAKKEPDLVTTPFDTDLEFTSYEQDRIIQLKDDNKLDELFRMLFIKQCNKLHDILPELFEKTDDYSELLLTISFTDSEGIIHHLINDIEDVDFRINDEMYTDDGKIKADGQVEIIGWLYQYYISKKHDEIVNIYKGTVKKADIPAATQLFTTDWVVRYMVDNSLGRYWIERNPQSKLAEKLEFFVTPKNGKIQYVDEKISPTDLTFFDPCMGSGLGHLHRIQRVYEKEITRMQEIIDNSHDNKEISNATKRKEKLQKQIKETKDYDAKIAHLALSRIDIDLDDGVKVNYEKVQTADGKKMQILAKIS